MRKILAVIMLCAVLATLAPTAALGASAYQAYVNNPNMADRLHLRESPDAGSRSLGKYYNGTPVNVLERIDSSWVYVRIGGDPGCLTGYMMSKYLTTKPGDAFVSAMPLYIVTQSKWTVYQQPRKNAVTQTFVKGKHVYLMGFTPDWFHMLVRLEGEGDYSCFIPSSVEGLTCGMYAYVSNPNKNDRLHLRVKPNKSAKSLGKYYNGSEGQVYGQSLDGKWSYVDIYGRKGFMNNDYLCFEGERNNTYYNIPKVNMLVSDALRYEPSANSKRMNTLEKGEQAEVYGVLEDWLHVFTGSLMGFVRKSSTSFKD